ncbi:FUSC family protein [Streptomyces sp. NPDC048479]|uniref:FUSC family protein n=1 Tax=Streptomyces sp. NPDC048479 TaxID=3154725 RepID=UPI003423069C
MALASSDPGMTRLLGACNTVGAILLSLGVLAALHTPVPFLVLAAATALVWSFVLTAPTLREQATAHALGYPAALSAATVAVLLAPHRVAADAVFVLLIFASVYIRRFGALGTAVGMNIFQLYFVAQFVPLQAGQLSLMWGTITVAFVCGAVVRFGLLSSPPDRTLGRLRRLIRACLADVVGSLFALLAADASAARTEQSLKDLHRGLARLHECSLMIQSSVELCRPPAAAARVQSRVVQADVAAERLVVMLLRARVQGDTAHDFAHRLHLPGRPRLRGPGGGYHPVATAPAPLAPEAVQAIACGLRSVRALVGCTRQPTPAPRSAPAPRTAAPDSSASLSFETSEALDALEDFENSVVRLWNVFGPAGRDEAAHATAQTPEGRTGHGASSGSAALTEPNAPEPRGLHRPTTRAALQTAAGSALATVAGELISPERWYWAVLACWMVFFNTASTGEILAKGYRRLLGTLVGVVAALGTVTLTGGEPWLAFIVVIACVFGMAFTAPWSYAAATFFLTLAIGELYTLLNTYSEGVLVVRIEETLLGVICGVIAALLVLPISTRTRADRQLRNTLLRLQEAVRELSTRLIPRAVPTGQDSADLFATIRHLDRSLEDLRRSMSPLTHPLAPQRLRRNNALYALGLLDTCAYHVRVLTAEAAQCPSAPFRGTPAGTLLVEAVGHIDANLATLARLPADKETEPGVLRARHDFARRVGAVAPDTFAGRTLRHFRRLDDDVLTLAATLGMCPCADDAPAAATPPRTG